MRAELFWNPRLLCERLARASLEKRRLERLRGTPACSLTTGHIDALELVDIAKGIGIDVVYDIGANAGTWTLLARSVMPHAVIHAFEPLSAHCDRFDHACRDLEGVRLHRIGLGAANTNAPLRVTDFSDASSFLSAADAGRKHYGLAERQQVIVPVRRLDDYRKETALPMPDMLKLDVQGYELEALKGAIDCLCHAKAVLAEVSFVEYYEKQCMFHEVVAFLADFGLQCRALAHGTATGRLLDQTDALFVRAGLI